jgi:hypothetical protein
MNLKGLTLILLLLLTWSCATTKRGGDVLQVNDIKIYESINGYGLRTKAAFDSLKVGSIALLGENILYDAKNGIIRKEFIAETLNERIPDVKYNGLIVLDWEGEKMKDIIDGVSLDTKAYKSATNKFIQAYDYIKLIRPKATVGYYGFPVRSYWKRDDEWSRKNIKLVPFLSHFDALFPSVYDFYQTTDKNRKDEKSYFKGNIESALEIGKICSKNVYPFIWHRYHNSNAEQGLKLIPFPEFEEQISEIVTADVDGQKIKGIIWWSSERYFYNVSNKDNKKSNDDFGRETDSYIPNYMNSIIKAIMLSSRGE